MSLPRLHTRMCTTCVFRPGNLMRLRPGRLAELIAQHRTSGTLLTCHQTLSYGAHPDRGEAVCRGYWNAYAAESQVAQVMRRLAARCGDSGHGFAEVDPPR